ncbi:thiamine diphosphokinase [Tannockella kyphosi]|uniref:thiamine diphosphokinase n=1 Tax=Tannockella kyphosi TaxID=2899121 RepID=UPI002013C05F|nr:thiamine diphosphokinase [Tannockella kyphosi]
MHIGICGASYDGVIFDNTIDYIGVDGGVQCLLEHGITPVVAIGDFDSLEKKEMLSNIKAISLNPVKDCSDSHYAIEYAIQKGYQRISLYGVTGHRLDHYMAIIALVQRYPSKDIHIIDLWNDITILNSGIHRFKTEYTYFSLFAFENTQISIQNAKYELVHYLLTKQDPLCLSNECLDKEVLIENDCPILLIQSNENKIG